MQGSVTSTAQRSHIAAKLCCLGHPQEVDPAFSTAGRSSFITKSPLISFSRATMPVRLGAGLSSWSTSRLVANWHGEPLHASKQPSKKAYINPTAFTLDGKG